MLLLYTYTVLRSAHKFFTRVVGFYRQFVVQEFNEISFLKEYHETLDCKLNVKCHISRKLGLKLRNLANVEFRKLNKLLDAGVSN